MILVTTPASLREACSILSDLPTIGFDIETTDLDPYNGKIRLVQLSAGDETWIVDLFQMDTTQLDPLRRLIAAPSPVKIVHNAKFEAKWIKHHLGSDLGRVFDTMLASQILARGRVGLRHSLAAVAYRFAGLSLDKSQQTSDWSGPLSTDQLEYAATDAEALLTLRHAMIPELVKGDLVRCAQLEFEAVMPVADMELNGLWLDRDGWMDLVREATIERDRLADELQDMLASGNPQQGLFFRPEINLNSNPQLLKAMKAVGVPLEDTTQEWRIQHLAKGHPPVAKLLEYRKVNKQLTSFGENILGYIHPVTGRIHAEFHQIGAPTGRFACRNPNIQQIPNEDRFRQRFRAIPGRKFIVADYSQIELRILAHLANDPAFIDAYTNRHDLHKVTAAAVFDVPMDEVTHEQRAFGKSLNFGVVYGMGPSRFALITGVSKQAAADMIEAFFRKYRVSNEWLELAAHHAVSKGYARTGSGRVADFNVDRSDRKQVDAVSRNGKNTPIQGTGADILKRAMRLLYDELKGTTGRIVNIVHDEIVVSVEEAEAEDVSRIVRSTMVTAGEEYVTRLPVEVSVAVTDAWSK